MDAAQGSPLHILPPSGGSFCQFRVPWETFVQVVLAVTVEAYQRMRRAGVARRNWGENTLAHVWNKCRDVVNSQHGLSNCRLTG